MLSVIAHLLICGPVSRRDALMLSRRHPLMGDWLENGDNFEMSDLRWCATPTEIVPADPWLLSLLRTNSCRTFGALFSEDRHRKDRLPAVPWRQIAKAYDDIIVPNHFLIEERLHRGNRSDRWASRDT